MKNHKLTRILKLARDIENSNRNIQRSKDREREFKGDKERVLARLRARIQEGDIPEDSILAAANAIRDERRQGDVQDINQRRVDYSSREILAIVGEDPDTQELSMGEVEQLARLALETDAAEG
jgi:hypothetical protein